MKWTIRRQWEVYVRLLQQPHVMLVLTLRGNSQSCRLASQLCRSDLVLSCQPVAFPVLVCQQSSLQAANHITQLLEMCCIICYKFRLACEPSKFIHHKTTKVVKLSLAWLHHWDDHGLWPVGMLSRLSFTSHALWVCCTSSCIVHYVMSNTRCSVNKRTKGDTDHCLK